MITTCVATLGLNVANVKILIDESRYEVCKPGKNVMKCERISLLGCKYMTLWEERHARGMRKNDENQNLLGINKIGDNPDFFFSAPLNPGSHIELRFIVGTRDSAIVRNISTPVVEL